MLKPLPAFPKPLDDLLQKVGRSSQTYARELGQKLARYSQATLEALIHSQRQKVNSIHHSIEEMYQSAIGLCKQVINGPPIRIELSTRDVKQAQSMAAYFSPSLPAKLVEGKAFVMEHGLKKFEVDCVIASKNWHKMGEIKGHTVNLMDYLDKLLPVEKIKMSREEKIGIVTFQNGMANKLQNFTDSCQTVFNQFTEAPLCIGLYNATMFQIFPTPIDMSRFAREKTFNQNSVYSLCRMMATLADMLPKMNPNLYWVHFAHSEGGLIGNAALEVCHDMLFQDTCKYLQNKLITSTYGAVKPIPDEYTKYSINTYSKNDIVLFYGNEYIGADMNEMIESGEIVKKFHKGKTYSIKAIASKTERIDSLKMPVEIPKKLSPKEVCELSFFEYLAYREETDNNPVITQSCLDLANDFFYRVKDHGFDEASYKKEFQKNAQEFIRNYKI